MNDEQRISEATRDLVEEVMRSAVVMEDVLSGLLGDLPDEAFPGEDKGEVLLEMVIGTVRPAVADAGERACRTAISLVGAIRERILADLHTAVEMQRRSEARGVPDGEGRR